MTGSTRSLVVSICGPSGAGKSTVAKAVAELLAPTRCVRIPGDLFLVPAKGSLDTYWQQPHAYDWSLLAQVLAAPDGTVVGTPDFDFDRFVRVSPSGGTRLLLRPIRVIDTIRPYPAADLVVRLSVPPAIRRQRIIARDAVWGSQVIDRWEHLEQTFRAGDAARVDLELSGCDTSTQCARGIVTAINHVLGQSGDHDPS